MWETEIREEECDCTGLRTSSTNMWTAALLHYGVMSGYDIGTCFNHKTVLKSYADFVRCNRPENASREKTNRLLVLSPLLLTLIMHQTVAPPVMKARTSIFTGRANGAVSLNCLCMY